MKKFVIGMLILTFFCGTILALAASKEGNAQDNCHYPVTVETRDTAWNKVQLHFKQKPQRCLAIHQNNIETFVELDEIESILASQGQYVAVTPEEQEEQARLIPKLHYSGQKGINQEKAVYLEPDFILGWSTSFTGRSLWGVGDTDFWKRRGVNCYTTTQIRPKDTPQTVLGELQYVQNMGRIFNKEKLAVKYIQDIESYVREISKQYAGPRKQRVLVLDVYESYIGTNNRDWVVGDMITRLGGEVVEISPWTSKEEILMTDPDVIFLLYKKNTGITIRERFMQDRVYKGLRAVKNKRVYTLPMTYVLNNSWKIKDGLELIAHGLYPHMKK